MVNIQVIIISKEKPEIIEKFEFLDYIGSGGESIAFKGKKKILINLLQ